MAVRARGRKGSPSSAVLARLARAVSTAVHDHLTHPGVSFVAGGITPRRTSSSTVLSDTLSSQANSLRLRNDGGRLAMARVISAVPLDASIHPYALQCRPAYRG